ncbi:MAG: hypothetical protein FWH03_08760 [Firmicutes bacterium]|nr:hypothetical protein [Bacillota bacterium]
MPTCDFELCIYQKNKMCTLDKIHINNVGLCADCNIPYIEGLNLIKETELKKYEDRYAEKDAGLRQN